jgi:hypothetical protein
MALGECCRACESTFHFGSQRAIPMVQTAKLVNLKAKIQKTRSFGATPKPLDAKKRAGDSVLPLILKQMQRLSGKTMLLRKPLRFGEEDQSCA